MDLGDLEDTYVGLSKRYGNVGLACLISLLMILSCRPLGSNQPSGSLAGISMLEAEVKRSEHPPFPSFGPDNVRSVELQHLPTAARSAFVECFDVTHRLWLVFETCL